MAQQVVHLGAGGPLFTAKVRFHVTPSSSVPRIQDNGLYSCSYFFRSDAKVNKAQDGLSGTRDSLAKWGGVIGSLPDLGNIITNDKIEYFCKVAKQQSSKAANDNHYRTNLTSASRTSLVKVFLNEEIPKEKLASSIGSNFSNKKKDSCAATEMLVTLPSEGDLFSCMADNEDFFGSSESPFPPHDFKITVSQLRRLMIQS